MSELWILNAFLSAFFAGLTSILSKIGLEDISSHYVTALRTSVVLVFTWLMYFVTGSDFSGINETNLIYIILSGLATGASWLCYYRALALGDVSQVVPIDKLSTFLTMIFAFIIFHEEVTFLKIICIFIMFYGTYLMQKREKGISVDNRRWLIYAIGSAIFASLTSILAKIGISQVDSQTVTAIRTVVVMIMAWLVVIVTRSYQPITSLHKKQVGAIVFSALATGLSWLCYFAALKEGPASIVVPIDKLSIVVSILFASLVLHERQNIKTIIGLICIVVSTLLLLIA